MNLSPLIEFLHTELAVPADSIAMALRHSQEATHLLPMVLWQYGLVDTQQLELIFQWQATQPLAAEPRA